MLFLFFSFRKLGDDWSVDQKVTNELEAFTCLMHGHANSAMLKKMVGENEVLTSKPKVDLSRLPPCRDSLVPHIGRVNYRLANYKRAHKSIFWRPNPYDPGQGWEKTEEGILEPVWSSGPVLSPSLVDLLQKTVEEAEVEQDDGQEIDIEELLSDDEDM